MFPRIWCQTKVVKRRSQRSQGERKRKASKREIERITEGTSSIGKDEVDGSRRLNLVDGNIKSKATSGEPEIRWRSSRLLKERASVMAQRRGCLPWYNGR